MKNVIQMNKGNEDKEVKEIFEEFIQYSQAKNLAKRTIGYYENNFERFNEFLQNHSINYISEIDPKTIQKFTLRLRSKIENPKSINTILRAVRAFLYYAMKLDYLDDFKIELLKTKDEIKETYTSKELELLLEKPDLDECNFAEYRNWVMVNFFLGTGARLRSVRNVKIKDLDFENGYVQLKTTKNRRQQIIPLSIGLSDILQEYLTYRSGKPEDWLFPTIHGGKLTSDGAGSAIRRYNLRRGVDKTSIHLFRHTFAKHWILSGGDIFRLQKILGHSSLDVVKEYANMFDEDLKKGFDDHNLLNQFIDNSKPIKLR